MHDVLNHLGHDTTRIPNVTGLTLLELVKHDREEQDNEGHEDQHTNDLEEDTTGGLNEDFAGTEMAGELEEPKDLYGESICEYSCCVHNQ